MPLPCLIGLDGPALTDAETNAIRRFQPAGFVLFSRNIETASQTRELTGRLRELCAHTPVIAIDQEGGRVVRTAALGLQLPSARTLRQANNPALIDEAASLCAESLLMLGINTDFAPVLDISHDETLANALPGRCWGTDAQQVISNAGMFNASLARGGMAGCGKHFPGMGRAQSDPHDNLPVLPLDVTQLLECELLPFMALAPKLPAIMTAHLMLPAIDPGQPASLSHTLITGLLRGQLGYKGIVFTDDLCMGAITKTRGIANAALTALSAGCDLPLICHDPLPHLNELAAGLAQETNGFAAADRERRLHRFTRKLVSPLPWKQPSWDGLLQRSAALLGRLDASSGDTPLSAVQRY